MNKQQAQQIIKTTFESPFDKDKFIRFIKNFLNRIDESKAFHARGYTKEGFKHIIKTYERLGTYYTTDEKKIDIIVAYLQKGHSLDHARVTQRNFAGKYLVDRGEKDAGLFAFVSPDERDWRFSLVKMDYKFEKTKTGRMKVKEEFTPARRWSFLVGANEKSHTAQSRLVNILANDEQAPTLEEIEKAFDIETVTKEFFLKYSELFLRTKEELDRVVNNDKRVEADFRVKGVDTVNFAKNLLGQIVFLYFMQKKGWFGVGRDDDWGTGSKHFLRELFEGRHIPYKNFFNDILEPLFYDALSRDRSDIDHWNDQFKCKIPFLNGGLFDPIGNYSWYSTDILLPDKLFSNTNKTKEGDTGDGILDIFDRYNFTVKEDEPLEKEVAIDPELLGKAYEKFNAIRLDNYDEFRKALKSGRTGDENKFNKKFGVYYTPREIVHYMCQQSLINYLAIELEGKESKEDIETLIHIGEQVSENEARVLRKGKETETYSHQLPESIRTNAKLIDDKLAEITVCDTAVGSGAFPVGMMSEIVKIRNVLTPFLSLRGAQATKQSQFDDNRTIYDFKRCCIEHALYGVDIDPGAVEIAKLRLWLSLVVDEEDIKNIKPLPNLDYKIVCGDSLLGYPYKPIGLETIEKLKEAFFKEVNPTKKKELRNQIDEAIYGLFKNTEKNLGYKVTMDFKINFSEVFRRKGGFDVVNANPPYIDSERMVGEGQLELRKIIAKTYKLTKGNWDIYIAFFEKGFNLLNSNGTLSYITPDKWISKPFGDALRISKIHNLSAILKAGREVFEDAKVDAIVSSFSNKIEEYVYVYLYETEIYLKDKIHKKKLKSPYTLDSLFSIGLKLIQKVDDAGICLADNFLCENACATSDAYKLKPLIHPNKGKSLNSATHFKIVNTGTIGKYFSKWDIKPMVYLGDKYLRPVIIQNEFFKNFKKAYSQKTLRPKIILKGLNLLDAFLDNDGTTIPGKTTLIITSKRNNQDELKFMLALINSSLMYYYISEKYSASSYNQGITFTKAMINSIPLPNVNSSMRKNIISTVNRILAAKSINPQTDTTTLEREIDHLIYKFYDLTHEEIKIVEGENENVD